MAPLRDVDVALAAAVDGVGAADPVLLSDTDVLVCLDHLERERLRLEAAIVVSTRPESPAPPRLPAAHPLPLRRRTNSTTSPNVASTTADVAAAPAGDQTSISAPLAAEA